MKVLSAVLLFAFLSTQHAGAQTVRVEKAPPASTPQVTIRKPEYVPEEVLKRELKDIDGRPFRLSDFEGSVVVLDFWATWCGPCRFDIPQHVKLKEEFAGRRVEFVGLTTENPVEDGEKVRSFAAEYGMNYKIGWADEGTWKTFFAGTTSIPQTFVIAGDGQIVVRYRGYSPRKAAALRGIIEKTLTAGAAR